MLLRRYIVVGIIAYLLFLVTSIPAAPVVDAVNRQVPIINISHVSGSLWNGHAGTLDGRNGIKLEDIQWKVIPWQLLTGRLTVDVTASFLQKPVGSRVSINALGAVTVQDININLDASEVANMIALPLGELLGSFSIKLNQARMSRGSVPTVNGLIKWNEAAISVAETAELGNVSIVIDEADSSPLSATISNVGGDLALNGTLTTTEEGTYSLELSLKPTASASDNLVNSMSMFAKKQANGSYLFNNKGNLKQLGLM